MLLGDRDITGTYVLKISELSLKIFLQIRFLATVYGNLDLSQSGLAVEIGYSFGTFDVFVIYVYSEAFNRSSFNFCRSCRSTASYAGFTTYLVNTIFLNISIMCEKMVKSVLVTKFG